MSTPYTDEDSIGELGLDEFGQPHPLWESMYKKAAEIAFGGASPGEHHIMELTGRRMHAHVCRHTVLVVDPKNPELYVEVRPCDRMRIIRGGAS